MTTASAAWTPAGMSAADRMNTPTECGCCGRQGLKTTVKMTDPTTGAVAWMGTGCAARAMGVDGPQFRDLAKQADAVIESARRADRAARDADLDAFLVAQTGQTDRRAQLDALGGFAPAMALYRAQRP